MRIAYIHQHFSTPQGSTGTRSYEMARRLVGAGHDVTIICGAYDHAPPELRNATGPTSLDVDGIRVVCIPQPYSNRMSFLQRVRAFGTFARNATQVLAGMEADLVFASSTPLTVGLPGMKAARRMGVPFVFEVRDLWPELPIAMGIVRNPALKWYLRRMERKIYFAAERIIALSPGMKDGICRTGYPAARVTVVPNAADLELFRPDPQPLADGRFGAPGDFRLVFTGAHGRANGLDAVLNAAGELKRRGVKGVRLVFIGSGGEKDRLMARSRGEGLDTLVSWVDPLPKSELANILPRMNAGMMILKNIPEFHYGTSPNKFFDYISCGLPVINNYPGWLAEMIAERQCGLVVPPDNTNAFADAIVWLRDHAEERKEMGVRSRHLAEDRFSRDILGGAFVSVLEEARASYIGNKPPA